ncbi:hypothetical protein BEH94_11650 [Candidatus Altiarchaeales archaeon WOR_SM1_SCG]|nr:hypothetical protein BEH94_11650 [Candidatus Altiarchaeales archaeon WOR_SM1_SCG]
MKTKIKLNVEKILITVMICFIFIGFAGAEDWPMFMHDLERTGETSDVIENPEDLKLKWKSGTGVVWSSPAVSGDYVYVSSKGNVLYCFDRYTGELKWKFRTGGSLWSPPIVSEEYVYIGSLDGYIYCIDKHAGELKWKTREWKIGAGATVSSTSLTVSEDYIYIGVNIKAYAIPDLHGYYLCCLNKTSPHREIIWKTKIGNGVTSAAISGDYIYVGSGNNSRNAVNDTFYCIDKNTGEVKWKTVTGPLVTGPWSAFSTPVVSGDYVYIGSYDNHLYCYDKNTGELAWKFKTGDYIESSPAVSGNYIYVPSTDEHLYCLDKTTGKEIWKVDTRYPVLISPAISGDYIYIGAWKWGNYIYALDKSTGEVKWKFKTDAPVDSAAVSENYVYVGDWNGSVYAFAIPLKLNDESCSYNSDCQSKHCVHEVCRSNVSYCGDNYCDSGENYSSCSSDCEKPKKTNDESCSYDADCQSNHCVHGVCRPTDHYCGDNYCDSGETYSSCPSDCKIEKAEKEEQPDETPKTIEKTETEKSESQYIPFQIIGILIGTGILIALIVLIFILLKQRK